MRIMVGLTPASGGAVTIGGHRYADIPNPGRHVGVLLDASAQHGGRTGREVLSLAALTMGLPGRRVEDMLDLVGLSRDDARRRVRTYSLGMRQRLGIAHAFLGAPSVLVLDEPANGLDPAGIHWMRGMLRDFAARGGTVLLSSHLLHEVEMIADDVVVIGRGRVVAKGSKSELLRASGTLVRAVETEALRDALAEHGLRVVAGEGPALRVDAEPVDVGRVAAQHALTLVELRAAEGAGLEALFLELTAESEREGAPA